MLRVKITLVIHQSHPTFFGCSPLLEDELKKFPKNKILEIFRLFNKNWWTVDSLWFSTIEKEFGVEIAKKINFKVSKTMAPIMAKRIMKTLNLKGENLQDLAKALKFIVWSTIQKIDVKEQTKDKIIMRVLDCVPQKTRIKMGEKEFPCKPLGTIFLSSFAETINPKFKVKCLTAPPDPHPKNVWCEWEFYVQT